MIQSLLSVLNVELITLIEALCWHITDLSMRESSIRVISVTIKLQKGGVSRDIFSLKIKVQDIPVISVTIKLHNRGPWTDTSGGSTHRRTSGRALTAARDPRTSGILTEMLSNKAKMSYSCEKLAFLGFNDVIIVIEKCD